MPARIPVALVTDSTCDLPAVERLDLGLTVVPLHVLLGETSYLDGVDLTPPEFYRRFLEAGQSAQSAQPSVGEFEQAYSALLEEHEAVVSVHISGRLSGTVQSATIAAERFGPGRVHVVDSRQVSVGLGLVVRAAAEAVALGRDARDVAAAAEAAARDTRVYGTVRSLDVAVKGGRVSAPVARVAGFVELKPIIVFDDEGGAHIGGGHFGFFRALRALADRVAHFASGEPVRVAIAHADGREAAEYLLQHLHDLLGEKDVPVLEAGAVITTHVGLGAVAIAVQLEEDAAAGRRGPA